jgi:hypothetical protein
METPCWALVPPTDFQTAEQKRFDSTVNEVVHRLTMSLLDPKVANLQTQMLHTTFTSFTRSVQIPTIAGLNEKDLQKSAGAGMRENLSKHLGRNVRVFVDFWTEDRRKGKGKGKVQMASARVIW